MCTYTFEELSPPSRPSSHVDESLSNSDLSVYLNIERLSVQLNMGDHAYQQRQPSHIYDPTSPGGGLSTTAPNTVAYTTQDHPSTYASVAPFGDYSLTYESSLPTPSSLAGSPSLSERTMSKMTHTYSHNVGNSQQPTPPGTSRPLPSEWFNHQNHRMIPSSQGSSPMTINPSTDILQMHGLETSHSPEDHARMMAAAADQYHWGSYGVSGPEPTEDLSPRMPSQALFATVPHVTPSALIKNPMMSSSSHMPLAPALPQVQSLNPTPNAGNLGPPMTQVEGLHHSFGTHQPLFLDLHPTQKRPSRAKNAKRGVQKKRQRGPSRSLSSYDDDMDCAGDQKVSGSGSTSPRRKLRGRRLPCGSDRLRFKNTAPEALTFLYNLRCDLDVHKGKGMWDIIVEKWAERFERKNQAALQVKLVRAVAKYAIWPESEDQALLEAVNEYDRKRHEMILKIMKEKGGCVFWDWKPPIIAKRLIELGEEEYNPRGNGKKARRAREALMSQQSTDNLWNAQLPPNAIYDDEGMCIQTRVTMTSEEEDLLIQTLIESEPESPDQEPELIAGHI
ncbi:hypothetical protein BJ170DRAFT_409826 [Xylariales sp. AK1849]|nr:hypothetical protein BJ170DRAFT_409826 [Xylariales sp. AK1849]